MPIQQKQFFQDLHAREALRGDQISYRIRWAFLILAVAMAGAMIYSGRYRQAAWAALGFLALAVGNNYLLGRHLGRGLVPLWMRYLSTSCDILLITAYNYVLSAYVSSLGVSTSAAILVYPIILLFVALRLDKAQLVYAIALTLLCFNVAYFLRYPYFDQALVVRVVSSDVTGHIFKSIFLLCFGLALFFIPQNVRRQVNEQATLFRQAHLAEEQHLATLEAQVQLRTQELSQANQELRQALAQVKTLSGLLPICAHCKNIRDDQGYWQGVETYIAAHSQADFSHGICPECLVKHFPDFSDILDANPRASDKEGEGT
jgi:signal transduction histidine kinase